MVRAQTRLWKTRLATSAIYLAAAVVAFVPVSASAAEREPAVENILRRDVEILASPEMGGRLAGSPGGRLAVAHIAGEFKKAGLDPAPGLKDYFQSLSFTTSVTLDPGNSAEIKLKDTRVEGLPDRDFLPASFSDDCNLKEIGVVFAGFGIRSKEPVRDDYMGLDVKGKAVIVLRGGPDGEDSKGKYAAYHATRYKASIAKELGAAALLVTGISPEDDDLPKLRTGAVAGSAGLPIISIKRSLLESMLRPSAKTIPTAGELQKPGSFNIGDVSISLMVKLRRDRSEAPNVLGYLPATVKTKETLVLGAHWDHLGTGIEGSLAEKWDQVHPGADDNASGVAGMLELARELSKLPSRKRNILFMAFAAEELGGLGSAYFTKNATPPIEDLVAMINLDMIGRLRDKKLVINGSGTSSFWKDAATASNIDGLTLSFFEDGYGASDHSNFYAHGIPVLFFFTGAHGQYHLPDDKPDTLNYEGEASIVALVKRVMVKLLDLPARPDYIKTEASGPSGGGRNFQVYVGTVPDFTEETKGFKVLSVRAKSPAESAGIKAGDLMVQLGEKKIENIYDYTYALQDYKPGQTVNVTVIRNGTKVILFLTFGKRPGSE
jgi:hypothetical protein